MHAPDLKKYFLYSLLIHIALLGWIILQSFGGQKSKIYYTIDFLGGAPAGGGAGGRGEEKIEQAAAKAREEPAKVKTVDPREDLLIKSKKKPSPKEKEVISAVPAPPSIPEPKIRESKADSVPGGIPGAGSGTGAGDGIGIGFGSGTGGFGSGGSSNFPYTWYVHAIRKKLDANWNVSSGFSQKIFTQVAFTVGKDGSIRDIAVEESSKNEVFDRAAVRAVEYTHPLPPLPSDFSDPELRVHVRFTVKR